MSTPSSDTPLGPPPTYEEAVKGSVSLSFNSSKEVEQNHLLIFSDKEQYEFKIEDLEEEERIGGRVDTINRFRHVLSGKKLAIKLMNLHISRYYQTGESNKIHDLKKETEKFRKLSNHPNVLQFYGIFIHERNILLCMELMDLSLDFLIEFFNKKMQIFPEELLGIIVVAVVNALGDCQAQAIKHSYIKPQHILLNYNGDIKLGDFGETRIMHNDLASTVENKSLYYWPPERFELDYQLDYLSSVWSLGITILEAVCGKLPFENIEMRLKAVQEQICNFDADGVIRRVFHTEKEPYYSQEIRKFVKSCLKRQSERSKYQNLKETTFYVKYKEIYNNELVSKYLRNLKEKEIQSQQPIDTPNIIESFDNDNTNKLIFPHTPKVEYMFDINHFVKTNFLQEGCVYSYFHQPSQRAIAVKLLHLPASKSDSKDAEKVEKLKNELENFRLVSYYPTIVDFYGLAIYRSQIWICMELMDVSLHTFYHWYKVQELNTPEWLIGIVTVSMVDALNFCQSKNILHRDIKPRNILLNKNGDVKLCDFGESIATNISSGTRLVGTISYMAPEMIKTPGIEQDAKTDVWSLGITLLEIAYKQLPYGKSDNIVAIQHLIINMDVDKIIQKCFAKQSSPRIYYSPDLGEFIRTCLKEYDYRPHFKTLRKEPFYQSNKNEENRYRKKLAMKVKKMLTSSGINAEEKATIQNLDTSDKNLINGLNKEENDRFEKIVADVELSLKHLTTLTLPEEYNIEIDCDYLFSAFFNLATMDLDLNEDCCAQIRKKCDSIVVKEQILESYIKSFEDFVETRNGDGTDIESYDVCRIRSGIKIFIDILYEKSENYRFLQNFMQKDGPIEQLNEQIKQWHKYFYCIDRNDRPKSFEKRRADHWWWFC